MLQEKEIGRKGEEIRMLKEKNKQVESYDQKVLKIILLLVLTINSKQLNIFE
jgi:hypothetical protein